MSTISLIREVERRIAEQLVGEVLLRGAVYHFRRGIRRGCECGVCSAKRKANSLFSFNRSNPVAADMYYHAAYDTARGRIEQAKKCK